MDYDILRIALAATLGPFFWALVRLWLEVRASRRAGSERRRREQQLQRSYLFGRKLSAWLRRRHRR